MSVARPASRAGGLQGLKTASLVVHNTWKSTSVREDDPSASSTGPAVARIRLADSLVRPTAASSPFGFGRIRAALKAFAFNAARKARLKTAVSLSCRTRQLSGQHGPSRGQGHELRRSSSLRCEGGKKKDRSGHCCNTSVCLYLARVDVKT